MHKTKARKISNSFERCFTKSNLIENELIEYGLSIVLDKYKQELKKKDTINVVFESGIHYKSIYIFHKYKSSIIQFNQFKSIDTIIDISDSKHKLRIYNEIYFNKSYKKDCWFWGEGNMYVYYFKLWSFNTNHIEFRKYSCDSLLREPIYKNDCK